MHPVSSGEAPALTARLREKTFDPCQQSAILEQSRRPAEGSTAAEVEGPGFRFSLRRRHASKTPSVELEEQSCDFARVNLAPSFLI